MKKIPSSQQLLLIKPKSLFNWDMWEPVVRFSILVFGITIIAIALKQNMLFHWEFYQMGNQASLLFKYMLFFSSLIFVSSLAFRTYLWFKYRAYDSAIVENWPDITVVIPAYNESEIIYQTICSITNSNYPLEKLKIIGIDDGSTDDTYFHMKKAAEKFPRLVELIKFSKNQGKRKALYQAYKKSTTPYVITVDSDTRLDPNAIREIISPLILNEKIGAVTGRIKIWNSSANLFTKMLNAHFAMAFDFTRAVQSTFSSVFCLSGAFSAYRSEVLHQVLEKWLNQKFLNKYCTYGEDRSLTNLILRSGFGTFYQRKAYAFTIIPVQLQKILKMLTRWARSNIRESIIFSSFMLSEKRKGNRILPFLEFFSTVSLLILHFIWFYYFLFSGFIDSHLIFRILAYSILFGFFYMLYYLRIEGKRDFPYVLIFSIFSSIFTIWIFTTAGLTITKKSWSTR
ncbi:MAG: glycosyltransferase family 2 protein [Candidatus Aminicenantes bacterium]|nr:glycosyltransferase family 2 protein [Candidatus Aminicenantes bacterium]